MATDQEINKRRGDRIGAAGMLKRAEIIHALPVAEQEELETLDDRREVGKLSAEEEQRHIFLWRKASDGYQAERARRADEPPDTWFEDLKARMWAKHDAEQAKPASGS